MPEGKAAHGEDLANLDDNVSQQEELHFSVHICELPAFLWVGRSSYLRPTAACFRSERHIRTNETRIAMNASNIDPISMSKRP
jgi:hypothetical protein